MQTNNNKRTGTTRSTFSYYRTNVPNLLGGYMCFDSLERAIESGATRVYFVTLIKNDNTLGKQTGAYLCKELWCNLIWEA